MNPFDELLRDSVSIRKKDGTLSGPYQCKVQPDKIDIMEAVLDVEEGDSVERKLPNGKTETYAVLEAQFSKGLHMIPDSWILHVRKDTSLKALGVRHTTINIANANAIQIGDHNVQQISSVLQSLVMAIDQSDASHEAKKEAKSKLADFLRHPAVTSTLGAAAASVIRTVMGG